MKMEENHNATAEEDSGGGMLKKCWDWLMRNAFVASSLAAVVLGVTLGLILLMNVQMSELAIVYLGMPGELLMRMLQIVSVPLIVTSVMKGVAGLSMETSRNVSLRAGAYFVLTSLLAVITGLALVSIIKPGELHATFHDSDVEEAFSTVEALIDLSRNMFPHSMFMAAYQQYKTVRWVGGNETDLQNSSLVTNETTTHWEVQTVPGTNILGLIVMSFIFGRAFNRRGEKAKVIVEVLTAVNELTKKVVDLILSYLPIGLIFMIASHVVEVHDWETTAKLGMFIGVVLLGLVIHGGIVLPLIYFLCTRHNPLAVFRGVTPALFTALIISSSSATLPFTFQCCEERLRIDSRITRFMLPIGTNINMDGTALYEVVAAVFIAQLNHIPLDISQLITIAVTTTVSTIGAAGIPATGAVTTLFVLSAVGLPAKEASILVVVEWILDRCNTVINVLGDCIGVALVQHLSQHELNEMPQEEMTSDAADGSLGDLSSQASDGDSVYTTAESATSEQSDSLDISQDED